MVVLLVSLSFISLGGRFCPHSPFLLRMLASLLLSCISWASVTCLMRGEGVFLMTFMAKSGFLP